MKYSLILSLLLVAPMSAQQAPLQDSYHEISGVQEFSGRLIARPLSVQAHLLQGATLEQARERHLQASETLAAFALKEYVVDTDEYVLWIPAALSENQLSRNLMATGLVQYAEPDWLLFLKETTPNDPKFGQQWHHSKMKSTKAWDFGTGDGTFIACTVDTGVDLDHADLQASLVSGYNSADRKAQSNGGNVNDVNGHGTNTLGCVGAIGNNNIGVVGMGWDLKLMPVRCTNSSGGGAYLSDLTDGARWASDNGARAVSVSYSGGDSSSVGSTGTHLRGEDSLLSWASGNSGVKVNGSDHANVIVVGATNNSDNRVSWSNYGNWIDVVAPGEGIMTTSNGGGYSAVSGTSFSTPIVNGVIAMMMVASPNSSADDIEQMLFDNCVDIGATGNDVETGHGRPNFFKCMEAADAANGGGGGGGNQNIDLAVTNLVAGQDVLCTTTNAGGWALVHYFYSMQGAGTTPYPSLSVDLGLINPRLAGKDRADANGNSSFSKRVPNSAGSRTVWIQAAVVGYTSNVVQQVIQ